MWLAQPTLAIHLCESFYSLIRTENQQQKQGVCLKEAKFTKDFFDVFGHKSGRKYRFGHEFDSVLTGELTFMVYCIG